LKSAHNRTSIGAIPISSPFVLVSNSTSVTKWKSFLSNTATKSEATTKPTDDVIGSNYFDVISDFFSPAALIDFFGNLDGTLKSITIQKFLTYNTDKAREDMIFFTEKLEH